MTAATYSEIRDMYPSTSLARSFAAAVRDGWRIDKAADPINDAAIGISVVLAEEVAAADAGLLSFVADEIVASPDLPYCGSMFDCRWDEARRVAADLGPRHVAFVDAAERLADDETEGE